MRHLGWGRYLSMNRCADLFAVKAFTVLGNWLGQPERLTDLDSVVSRIKGVLSCYSEFINHMNTFSYDDAGINVVYLEDESV